MARDRSASLVELMVRVVSCRFSGCSDAWSGLDGGWIFNSSGGEKGGEEGGGFCQCSG